MTHGLQTLTQVHAAHDIHQGRHTVVKQAPQGVVVDLHPSWSATTYPVEFAPVGIHHRKPAVTLVGLTERDVQPD